MKICAYVQGGYAKAVYKNENFNTRQWVGLSVIIDALERQGYEVEYAGMATVHTYDWVLVSITSDCDWWSFVAERRLWQPGPYKVIVGGAGVLNVRPFLRWADFFVLGRGENTVPTIIREGGAYAGVIESAHFAPDRRYEIMQAPCYSYEVQLTNGKTFKELTQGCNHKCLYCGYTWQRKYIGSGTFAAGSGLWSKAEANRESAILDMYETGQYDFKHLRITSLDGFSERLRYSVNKRISREMVQKFLKLLGEYDPPHQLKIYNLVGLPTETEEDYREFLEDLEAADWDHRTEKQWSIVMHCTPFRPMPATPLACAPASYRNYRGALAAALGEGRYKGNIFYQGNRFWAVEGMGTDSLSTHALSMICHRGTEADTDNVERVAAAKKFWAAKAAVKEATLERYFDMPTLFGAFTAETLPTRYLKTYASVEKYWPKE